MSDFGNKDFYFYYNAMKVYLVLLMLNMLQIMLINTAKTLAFNIRYRQNYSWTKRLTLEVKATGLSDSTFKTEFQVTVNVRTI